MSRIASLIGSTFWNRLSAQRYLCYISVTLYRLLSLQKQEPRNAKREGRDFDIKKSRGAQSLYTANGRRKYLTQNERRSFICAASHGEADILAFCWLLCETGCRISEALALRPDRIDYGAGVIVIESLKKRRSGVFRAVPISPPLMRQLRKLAASIPPNERIWPWCRMTGYRRIKEAMIRAGVAGPQASPKGLRHGFAVAAIGAGVPLNLVQRWLGHADLATTAIYTHAVGDEEREIARRMWKKWPTVSKK